MSPNFKIFNCLWQVLKSEDIKMALDDIELPPNCRSDATLLKAEPRLKEEPKVDVSEPALPLADTHPASERHAHSSSPAPKEEPLPATLGDSELRGAVAKLINPKAEVKKELRLDDDDVLRLLDPSALAPYPISLPMDLRSTTISRDKLSKRYGGSAMDTFPTPSAHKLAEHGRKNFMCINLSLWNPNGPQVPGHGGLFFTTAEEDDTWAREADGRPTVYTVFARLRSNEWLYLGQYELHSAPNLSAQQWCALSPYVRACWTKNICKKNWGARVRARIHLRTTLGHEPSRDEVDSARGNFAHVTPEQINSAFVAGEEYIETWSMKCVGYDEDFQKEIVELARG
ncbi:hypothetical protein C8Q70DRAFT_437956 [Cubamyces menziesii]|nr:hypothetical protein C8Q70DRAFT_437956 [Cubamyces menziesii]